MNINEQLSINAKKYIDNTAFIFQGEETSYLEFENLVRKFGSGLQALGYEKGDHIALITENSPYFLIALYGALRIGAVIIPINPIYTLSEQTYILTNSDVKGIIATDELIIKLREISTQLPKVHSYISCDSEAEIIPDYSFSPKMKTFTQVIQQGNADSCTPQMEKEDIAIILYTSGTTGPPKGTVLSHENLYYGAKSSAIRLEIGKDDRFIIALPMFHVFCLMVAINGTIFAGGTLLIMPRFSPKNVFKVAKDYEATIFAGVPTMFNYLLQSEGETSEKKDSFAKLRYCITGGAAMPETLLSEIQHTFGTKIVEGYGLTESSPVAFNPVNGVQKPGSIGKSVPYMDVKIVDSTGREVRTGERGELVVKGPTVMKGYYNMPEETAAVLNNDWLKTGDIARMDDEEYIYIVDRQKDVIIVKGFNVYPREVEEVLLEHPNVLEVAIVGAPHEEAGEQIIGYVAVKDDSVTENMLIEFCERYLTKYKVPSKIQFLNELPKNTTGKILKKVLRNGDLCRS
jgi:long-chain acyl-CoA synthetase